MSDSNRESSEERPVSAPGVVNEDDGTAPTVTPPQKSSSSATLVQQAENAQQTREGKAHDKNNTASGAHATQHRPGAHKPVHRAHFAAAYRPQVVRNPSQRNIMRLQALKAAAGTGAAAGAGAGTGNATGTAAAHQHAQNASDSSSTHEKKHVRKKSAPVGSGEALQRQLSHQERSGTAAGRAAPAGGAAPHAAAHPSHHPVRPGMKRNFSTPVFRHQRNVSGQTGKKAAAGPGPSALGGGFAVANKGSSTTTLAAKAGPGKSNVASARAAPREKKTVPKKTVGFQLSAESDESEWEDNSQSGTNSPASTLQNSMVAGGTEHFQQPTATQQQFPFPYPYAQGARSPLNQTSNAPNDQYARPPPHTEPQTTATTPASETPRFLYNKKAPPSVSSVSISAHAPLASAQPSQMSTATYRAPSAHGMGQSSSISGQGASSSVEGGVSRFLTNGAEGASSMATDASTSPFAPMSRPATRQITPRTEDSDKKGSRYRVSDLASRTQQRLWLERDAVTPSAHRPAASQSGLEINFQMGGYTPVHMSNRSFGPGSSANVQAGPMNPIKRDKKLYEKYTTEFSVVHRFKDPVADSFRRLQMLPKSDRDATASKDLGGIPRDYIGAHLSASTAQLSLQSHASITPSRRPSRSASSARFGSQVRFKTQDDNSLSYSSDEHADSLMMQKRRPQGLGGQHRQLPLRPATSALPGGIQEEQENGALSNNWGDDGQTERRPTDEEMLLRRIWNYREMATVGGDD